MMMPGRLFLQIPGPTNVPDRVLRAMAQPVIDHRGREFADLTREVLGGLKQVFQSQDGEVILYPASGTGGWEAAILNALAPGDHVVAFSNGQFSSLFGQCARAMGMEVDEVSVAPGEAITPGLVERRLSADRERRVKAVLVVHNETATGVTSDVAGVSKAMKAAGHPALLFVDTVSSLGSIDFHFDEWQVDVAITGSQKGLMLPPGMAILCAGPRALAAAEQGGSRRYFFDWRPILDQNRAGYFPYTPPTSLLYGLRESLRMLSEEGLEHVFARHRRLAEGVRRAVAAWGLDLLCRDRSRASHTLTAVVVPDGTDSGRVIEWAERHLKLSLGVGLGAVRGKIFRIGHLGWLNEVEVLGTLGGIEIALNATGIRVEPGRGVGAAASWFMEARRDTAVSRASS